MSTATQPRDKAPASLGAVIAIVTLVALALRAGGLGAQLLIGDDRSVGQTAINFVSMGWPEPTMWNHPRLRDLLVGLSLDALGTGPWGLKLWSVLFGTLAAAATVLLVQRLTSSLGAAAIAGLVVALDPLHVDFSRQAINDVYLSFFAIASILALLRYRDRRSPAWLALAGLLLGLGIASKWSTVFPVGVAAAVILFAELRACADYRDRGAEVALWVSALVLLPMAVYLLTWWPWFGRGHDLREFVTLQRSMAFETATHAGYSGTKLPGFPGEVVGAWRWFVQPIWYVDYLPPMEGRSIHEGGFFLSGVGNPLTWLATLPAAAWAGVTWFRQRDVSAGWLLLLFTGAYLPFVFVPRPIWTNSAVAVVPFLAALVGWAAAKLHERIRMPLRIWAAAAVALGLLLWPPAAGISTRPTDAVLRALVSRDAMDPATHLHE